MRTLKLILLIALLPLFGVAQTSIDFKPLPFQEAKDLAKEENKLIFLDAYTSWCAPCKWMESNVFVQPHVYEFFNANFINTKFDCEKGEGIAIAEKYQVRSFPTYLFIDGAGELVYRTQSRMEADAFLKEAENANNPKYHIPILSAHYDQGERSEEFLLRYYLVMKSAIPERAKEVRVVIDESVTEEYLLSKDGWPFIHQLAQNSSDRYAKLFLDNLEHYKEIAPEQEYHQKQVQLLRFAMYAYVRNGQKEEFYAGLEFFKNQDNDEFARDAALFELEWVAEHETSEELVELMNKLASGSIQEDDQTLSFIARRYSNTRNTEAKPSNELLNTCYQLASKAVELNPTEYSNQGTLAEICISIGKKQEAIQAAKEARALAELETSKIQGIADKLLERAENM